MNKIELQYQVEQFLYHEAALLDRWQLKEWEALFTDDGHYLVPPLAYDGAETADPKQVMFIVDDNRDIIAARVNRMLRKDAWVESPRSHIRHLISNVRVLSDDGARLRVSAYTLVFRARRTQESFYVGETFYTLVRTGDSLRIREKRVCLDNDILQPQGSLAIIV